MTNFIAGDWLEGKGNAFQSINSVNQETIWHGKASTADQVDSAVSAARAAQHSWMMLGIEARVNMIRLFAKQLEQQSEAVAVCIAKETGKVLWESRTEVAAMKAKVETSIKAYYERTGITENTLPIGKAVTRYKPHGVVAVFGPYNFPGHLPNGHIIPALLAGNTVVLKPSELTPAVAEISVKLWQAAGLPKGVINLVQGEKDTAISLANHTDIDGLFFTGSSQTGAILHQQFAKQSSKILALEMGGNNPLIIRQVANKSAAVYDAIQSAFITSGQRCTCARRLFVPCDSWGDDFLRAFVQTAKDLKIGAWDDQPEPFMGAVVSIKAADSILQAQQNLLDLGGESLLKAKKIREDTALLSPAIIDVSSVNALPDDEYFGPLVQVIRYSNFQHAIEQANDTRYGLSAGLFSDSQEEYELFLSQIEAGIVNWNRPTTGAAGTAPFGGVGDSGNHRPSAYFAADYCAYPVASVEASALQLPSTLAPGLTLSE